MDELRDSTFLALDTLRSLSPPVLATVAEPLMAGLSKLFIENSERIQYDYPMIPRPRERRSLKKKGLLDCTAGRLPSGTSSLRSSPSLHNKKKPPKSRLNCSSSSRQVSSAPVSKPKTTLLSCKCSVLSRAPHRRRRSNSLNVSSELNPLDTLSTPAAKLTRASRPSSEEVALQRGLQIVDILRDVQTSVPRLISASPLSPARGEFCWKRCLQA